MRSYGPLFAATSRGAACSNGKRRRKRNSGLRNGRPSTYLNWMPVLAAVLGLLMWLFHPKALPYAAPVLVVWACSKLVSTWLNRPPLSQTYSISASERRLAEQSFLKTWRFFAE